MIPPKSSRECIPQFARRLSRRAWRWNQKRIYKRRTPSEVFSDIYERGLWGESLDDLCSGGGTVNERYVEPYAQLVAGVVDDLGLPRARLVDLGCGDFVVGRRLLRSVGDRVDYVGVDVVPRLIERNRSRFSAPGVRFEHVDISAEPLPDGDLCLVRQVFQHQSNEQIANALAKLSQYPLVLVTEHQPTNLASARPNVDKIHGSDTRLGLGSGVFLEHPPFSVDANRLELVLEVEYRDFDDSFDQGVLRTYSLRSTDRGQAETWSLGRGTPMPGALSDFRESA